VYVIGSVPFGSGERVRQVAAELSLSMNEAAAVIVGASNNERWRIDSFRGPDALVIH